MGSEGELQLTSHILLSCRMDHWNQPALMLEKRVKRYIMPKLPCETSVRVRLRPASREERVAGFLLAKSQRESVGR